MWMAFRGVTSVNCDKMKTLFLLRHAKSSWHDQSLADFERPLNGRGRRAAELMGHYLKTNSILPEMVLSSPAVRARETLELVIKTAEWATEVRYDQRIYEASDIRLAEVVSEIDNERNAAMLVGHNPGLEQLLLLLTAETVEISTGTLAKVALDTNEWTNAIHKRGTLELLVNPRDLEGSK
jgi:phosphohistidine phosphatase